MQFRQGDVFLKKTEEKIENFTEIERDNNRIVLAYGEVTGHAHAIKSKNAILVSANNKVFLMVLKPVDLEHEEHSKINLPVGNYEVVRQRQYYPEEIKFVAD